MLLIIISTGNRLFRFINIDDFNDREFPKEGFQKFATHISRVNCDEMPEDRPKQRACEIFSIKRRF